MYSLCEKSETHVTYWTHSARVGDSLDGNTLVCVARNYDCTIIHDEMREMLWEVD